jgi:uncharacterized protein with NRDE domain
VCLLVVLAQTHPDLPLVMAANRDELRDRPAVPMTVLRESGPRILGGRDELAGGTWLAVNEVGVVAGLTNRPIAGPRDPAKRSRGELPIALASHRTAAAAVDSFCAAFRPAEHNPAWLIVADREEAFSIDMTGDARAVVAPLAPGLHLLENRAPDEHSPKVDHVRRLVAGVEALPEHELVARLQAALADHQVPPGVLDPPVEGFEHIPPDVQAACVHTERYGTRWSCVVTVSPDPAEPPVLRYADGPPCESAYVDAGPLWHTPS